MTLAEFQQQVVAVALASPICGIPVVCRLSATSINLRVEITTGDFVDIFYNEQTGTTAFALIRASQRIFGADNTGGWHWHPFANPEQHALLASEMSFAEFVAEIERH